MKTLNRDKETNIIGYELPTGHTLVCGLANGDYVVSIFGEGHVYSAAEIKETYNVDPAEAERLGWSA